MLRKGLRILEFLSFMIEVTFLHRQNRILIRTLSTNYSSIFCSILSLSSMNFETREGQTEINDVNHEKQLRSSVKTNKNLLQLIHPEDEHQQ